MKILYIIGIYIIFWIVFRIFIDYIKYETEGVGLFDETETILVIILLLPFIGEILFGTALVAILLSDVNKKYLNFRNKFIKRNKC